MQRVVEREGGLVIACALRLTAFSAYRVRQSVDSGVLAQMIRSVYALTETVGHAERDCQQNKRCLYGRTWR